MSETAPENDGAEDIDPADLDDLGDLGGDDDPDEKDGDEEYTPPDKDTWAKLQRKIKRQEEKITALTGKTPSKGASRPGKDVDDALRKQFKGQDSESEEEPDEDTGEAERWRGIAIRNAAASQIAAAGFSGTAKQAARLAKLIDTSSITPGRDGEFDLEDEIDELKDEYPQLFSTAGGNGRRPVPRVRTAPDPRTPRPDSTKSTSNKLLKSAGYL